MRKPLAFDDLRFRCLLVPAILLLLALTGGATGALAGADLDACRTAAHADMAASRLVCAVQFVPTESEQRSIVQDSANMVQDLRCTLSVDVARADLAAMAATDRWQAPAQAARCDVVTSRGSHDATFSLAPEITLIGGKAIGVRVNAGDFEGTPPLIAKALQSYINFNAGFQDQLMDAINGHLASWLAARKRAGT